MFLTGATIAFSLYFIWLGMSAIGLRGVTSAQQIQEIRQEAGLFLLGLALVLTTIFTLL